jgi:hypothetical protein
MEAVDAYLAAVNKPSPEFTLSSEEDITANNEHLKSLF